jgi:putative salt-induced outer membrane protein YdiY
MLAAIKISAQIDSIVTTSGQSIVGEIKNLSTGVLTMKTDYSDSDFKIEWLKIKEIYTQRYFVFSNSEGERITGIIAMENNKVVIFTGVSMVYTDIENIVHIKPIDKEFLDKLSASIEFGFSITKANNLKQINLRSNIGYTEEKWSLTGSFDDVSSSQDSIESTKRTDINTSFNYFIGTKGWFLFLSVGYLHSSEQKLDARVSPQIGVGNYIIQTNQVYLSFGGGLAFNSEKYIDSVNDRESGEVFLATELNLFDMGDLSLLTNLAAYKNMEEDRNRANFKFDIKYDLPLEFFIKLGYTLNYDSKPAEGASGHDYVLQTTLGWEL